MDEDHDGPLDDGIARRAVDVELEGHGDALLVDRVMKRVNAGSNGEPLNFVF
jgi:hypothetical protein